ncbi:nitrilase-related carbon-nitrogen hydrolase [Bacillus sp. FJAT-42315]|uniref:nitrilase-related carbon-nitrogen hydrolase n=1 Tax=Bacillus sp. FJAT-42315 TaxID=2014077 RepID=UPI000C24389B|nr:nitrilase-related carbon-nitrogen hydrolase [Bacillus sp. FJAT-42315]
MKHMKTITLFLLGAILMVLSNGKFLIAPAAWIYPIFFFLATKHLSPRKSLVILIVLTGICNQLSFFHLIPSVPIPFFEYLPALAGSMFAFPFFFQKLAYKKSTSFAATLIFPSTYALLDYLNLYFNPNGTFGVLGYSQYQVLSIAQLASVIGVVGITFVITWTASIIFWLTLDHPHVNKRTYIIGTSLVLIAIFTFGSVRVMSDSDVKTVAVSGIHTVDRDDPLVTQLPDLHKQDLHTFLNETEKNMEQLIAQTIQEAENGAKMIVHSEGTLIIDETQKAAYLKRLQEIAKDKQVYIIAVPYVLTREEEPNENVLYMIDSSGKLAIEHFKYGGNMFEGTVLGDKKIHSIDTEYGRLSGIICWDKDFPSIIDQVGEKGVDTLFIPSADWKEVTPYHTIVGHMRGIENGANTVTQSVNGLSTITNYKGEVLSQMNHFNTDDWVMRGQVPTQGTKTLYSLFGKYFVICVILALIGALIIIYRDQKKSLASRSHNETRSNL